MGWAAARQVHWCWWRLDAIWQKATEPTTNVLKASDGDRESYGMMQGQDWGGTEVTVRARRRAGVPRYEGWSFAHFDEGMAALRAMAQGRVSPDVARLSDQARHLIFDHIEHDLASGARDRTGRAAGGLVWTKGKLRIARVFNWAVPRLPVLGITC